MEENKNELDAAREAIARERARRENEVGAKIDAILKEGRCGLQFMQVIINGQAQPGTWRIVAIE